MVVIICNYTLSLGQMLFEVFNDNWKVVLQIPILFMAYLVYLINIEGS